MNDQQIHWYPGHMNKSWNTIKKSLSNFDCIFLLLDARAPSSSFLREFKEILKGKKVVILLTKSDLVDKKQLVPFINFYQEQNYIIRAISLLDKRNSRIILKNLLEKVEFKKIIPKILILGVPNVGKSTLLNVLTEGKKAKVEDRAGVTKTLTWYQFENKYWILDTPGILEPKYQDDQQSYHLALIGAFKYEILPVEEIYGYLVNNFDLPKENFRLNRDFDYYKNRLLAFKKGSLGKFILDKFEK